MYFQNKEKQKEKYLLHMHSVPLSSVGICAFSAHSWSTSCGTVMNVPNVLAVAANKSVLGFFFKHSDLTAVIMLTPSMFCSYLGSFSLMLKCG